MLRNLLAALLLFLAAADEVSIRFNGGAFQVTGWTASGEPAAGWGSLLTVSAGSGGDAPAMLGAYRVDNGVLVFQPRWPVAEGVHVRAIFHIPGGHEVAAEFDTARSAAKPSTRVMHIYPSGGDLPSNALRLYLYFSGPMRRGEAWSHIHLLDEKGVAAYLPFLEIDQELWDPGNTRLTVLFDPGRIKRGLVPLEESGPNLVEGRRYTLVVDAAWKDANGLPLTAEFRKALRVGPADREAVEPSRWRITEPKAGSSDPLVVTFPRQLDYALALRLISVANVEGSSTLARDEREWRFTPKSVWRAGQYQLVVNTALEDIAGNRVGRAFDVDTFTEVSKEIKSETVKLPFRIAPLQ